tara:strand:+ start:4218 stop:6608 length:2391 start_codon:yes stop_codon:yes gene_type:complete
MNWEDILKNIQISSQRTGSREYVKPDEDEEVPDVEEEEEDCSQWWIDLMDMCDELLEKWGGNKYRRSGFRGPIDYFTNDELCQKKQEIIDLKPTVINRYSDYDSKKINKAVIRFGKHTSGFVRFVCNSNELNLLDRVPTLEIHISINNKYIYDKRVKLDYKRKDNLSNIGKHIGHELKFNTFSLICVRISRDWEDSQNLEKSTIQIGSQKTSSRDYVKPEEDDEDCFKWWNGLIKIIKRMILEVNSEYSSDTLDNINFKNLTNEYLCERKEEILRNPTRFYSVVKGYLKYMGEHGEMLDFSASIDDYTPSIVFHLKLHAHVTPIKEEVFIQLEENTKDIKTYSPAAALELVKKFHTAELDLMDYLKINGNPLITQKLIEIYDDYLRETFDVKKNIQISGQRTSSRDYVKPDEDDEDCREWWRELHRIFNKMISAIDRNATLIIDNDVENVDNKILCELRDSILAMDVEQNTDGIYGRNFKYRKEGLKPYTRSDGTTINVGAGGLSIIGAMLDTKPGPYSGPYATRLNDKIRFSSYYGDYPNWTDLFRANVSLWNDSILYELDKIKENRKGKVEFYAYDLLEPFLEAELELKKHINDPNPAPFITTKLNAIYETYLNSDVKKSITFGSQKTSGRNYVKPEEPDCREEVQKIADKIMKFTYSDKFNMDNPVRETKYSKFYVNGYYEGMPANEINESERLSLETHFIENLDNETCCLILETIDKYKGQNFLDVEVSAPMADGAEEGLFIYTKEITSQTCWIQIFFSSGKHIATTLSLKLDLNNIPPDIMIEIEDIFESR